MGVEFAYPTASVLRAHRQKLFSESLKRVNASIKSAIEAFLKATDVRDAENIIVDVGGEELCITELSHTLKQLQDYGYYVQVRAKNTREPFEPDPERGGTAIVTAIIIKF